MIEAYDILYEIGFDLDDDKLLDMADKMAAEHEYYLELERDHDYMLRISLIDPAKELEVRGISEDQLRAWHRANIRKGQRDVTTPYINAIEGVDAVTDYDIARARDSSEATIFGIVKKRYLCPFHNDNDPSLTIKNGYFKCWACGASGDMIDLDMKVNNRAFLDSVKYLTL